MKILILDNHDSFTYNLAELLRSLDKVTFNIFTPESLVLEHIGRYDKILFSPGPGLPNEQLIMFDVLKRYGSVKPILGICLGFQAIALYFGACLFNLPKVVHGQSRRLHILRPDHYLFKHIPDRTPVGLYHSWAIKKETLGFPIVALAESDDGILMALTHRQVDICGFQFHPESIMTPAGHKMMQNWVEH